MADAAIHRRRGPERTQRARARVGAREPGTARPALRRRGCERGRGPARRGRIRGDAALACRGLAGGRGEDLMTERREPLRRLRALIADDEPRARQFMEKLLGEHDGIDVVATARGGVEALQGIAQHRPDVAFLDIQMPDLSGLEVARHLRGADAPIVVFVTAYDRYAVEAFELAALDYVLKPVRRERLTETVRRVAD